GAGVILIAALVLLGWAVLTNLIGNAWKFTGGRPEATIEIGCASTSQETTYFVGDNGAGFDMAYASKLFGVFQRLHRAEEFDGTGVGSPSCSASCSGTAGACRRRGR